MAARPTLNRVNRPTKKRFRLYFVSFTFRVVPFFGTTPIRREPNSITKVWVLTEDDGMICSNYVCVNRIWTSVSARMTNSNNEAANFSPMRPADSESLFDANIKSFGSKPKTFFLCTMFSPRHAPCHMRALTLSLSLFATIETKPNKKIKSISNFAVRKHAPVPALSPS